MYENLIPAVATATRIACLRLTSRQIATMEEAAGQCARLPRSPGWEHKAAAHAGFFGFLAEAVDDPAVAGVLTLGAEIVRDLAVTVGPAADQMIANSRGRLFAYLRVGDADEVEHEMEAHLRCLHFMWRLSRRPHIRNASPDTNHSADRLPEALTLHLSSQELAPADTGPGLWHPAADVL